MNQKQAGSLLEDLRICKEQLSMLPPTSDNASYIRLLKKKLTYSIRIWANNNLLNYVTVFAIVHSALLLA